MRERESVYLAEADAVFQELFFVASHACRGEGAHLDHARPQHLSAVDGTAARDIVGDASALPVGRTRERHERFAAARAYDAHRVAGGIYVGKRSAHEIVHGDPAVRRDLRAGSLCKRGLRRHAERKHDRPELLRRAVGEGHFQSVRGFRDGGHARARTHCHAVLRQLSRGDHRKFGIERRKYLRREFRQSDLDAEPREVLRRFHSYKTAARHEHGLHAVRADVFRKPRRVAYVAESEHSPSRPAEGFRRRAGREH